MFEKKIESRFRAFFIRVAFTFRHIAPSDLLPITRQPRLTCRTFVPIKYPDKGYENLHELMERVGSDISDISEYVEGLEEVFQLYERCLTRICTKF